MTQLEKHFLEYCPFLLSLFWAGWIIIVTVTDTIDYLQALGFVSSQLPMSSKNFQFLKKFTAIYHWNESTIFFIYQSIIGICYLLVMLSLRQFYKFIKTRDLDYLKVFHLALVLFTASFILADEIFINYETEHGHLLRFNAQLISLGFFYVVKAGPRLAKD